MIVRVLVETPIGGAKRIEKQLRGWLLVTHKPISKGMNKEGTGFYWELELTARQMLSLQKRIAIFANMASTVVHSKLVRKAAKKMGATDDMFPEVERMLREGTEVKIIKNATAQEMVEENKTYWQKIKERFK